MDPNIYRSEGDDSDCVPGATNEMINHYPQIFVSFALLLWLSACSESSSDNLPPLAPPPAAAPPSASETSTYDIDGLIERARKSQPQVPFDQFSLHPRSHRENEEYQRLQKIISDNGGSFRSRYAGQQDRATEEESRERFERTVRKGKIVPDGEEVD